MKNNHFFGWALCILVSGLLILSPSNNVRAAQTEAFSATDLLGELAAGDLSLSDAALQFAQEAGLPSGSAQNLLQSIIETPELSLDLAADVLEGFVSDTFDIDDLQNITDTLTNIKDVIENPEQGLDLIREALEGELPTEVIEALSTLEQLGDLADAQSIAEIFENPLVADALADLEIAGMSPQELLEQIETITDLISDPATLIEENIDQITEEILSALEDSAPEVLAALEEAFGADALETALGDLLVGLTGGTGFGGVGEPEMCDAQCTQSCGNCAPQIHNNHVTIRSHTSAEFAYYRQWMVSTYFIENLAASLMEMTTELVTGAMQQTSIIGTFFDSKHQLESQQIQQVLTAKAHKDYQPSEALCVVGTNTRSIASSKIKADLAKNTLATRMMSRQLNKSAGLSQQGNNTDKRARIDLFIEKFCNKTDGGADGTGQFGLSLLCANSNPDTAQVNADVNYSTTIENNLTLNADFSDDGAAVTADEENIFALGANLFAHDTLPILTELELKNNPDLLNVYIDLRAMAAKRSVAQNSFAAITGMRAEGSEDAAPFLKALLTESGIGDSEATALIGDKPSYFAQEEIMTKALYQNPSFYSNLYDKPANVERMGTSLLAMEIIQDRNIYESLLRSEAVLATLVETLTLKEHRRVSGDLGGLKLTGRKRGVAP